MEENFSELIEYLDRKFEKVDDKFGVITQKFIGLEEKIDIKADKEDVVNLIGSVDAYSKKADDYFQEMVMLSHKVDRHEKWLHQVAEKLGIKLEY